MSQTQKVFLGIFALIAVLTAAVLLIGPSMLRSSLYPKAHRLPAVVSETAEQLLAHLQTVLETNAPVIAQSLQPGLTDAQISELETRGGFHLSADLKALYRWHNGMATNAPDGLLPGQQFLSLEEMVADNKMMREE